MASPLPQDTPPAQGGSFLTRKVGPLPMWAWMAIVVGGLVAVVAWRNAHQAANTATTDSTVPPDQTPPMVFQDYVTSTPPYSPPAGGRHGPPAGSGSGAPPAGGSSGSGTSGGGVPVPPGPVKPGPTPTPTPHPSSTTVTVAKYTTSNPPWNSTLSGIAQHEGYGGDWQAIWNNAANAALKARRKQPNLIQPGDKIVVPAR